MNFESWLAAKGFDAETLTAAQRIYLESQWRAEQAPAQPVVVTAGAATTATTATAPAAGGTANTFEQTIADTQAELARRQAITTLVADYLRQNPDLVSTLEPIGRQALEGNWTKDQTELYLYRAAMPAGPSFFSPSKPKVDDAVIEAAVCRAAGLSAESVEKSYGDATLTAADKHFRSGVGIQRLLVLAAQANGYRDAGSGDWGRTLKAAFRDQFAQGNYNLTAGPSTIDVSTILSNVANKFSIDAFNAVESVWRKVTATRPVNDFKEITGVALTGNMTYQEIGSGGALKHGTLGEEVYGNKAKLYGILLGLDYKQIRNDDLGTFAKANRMMGRGGALTINKVFWKEYLDDAGFFTVGNGNYRANADVAMTLEGLAVAHKLWTKRTDPQGEPMGDVAKFLLVPTGYELAAKQYMTSTRISNDDGEGEANVLAGKWEVVSSTYLDNAAVQPGADAAARAAAATAAALSYYLLGDPNDLPVIETVFLDGKEVPTIESAEADFHQLGIELRAHHAFGCRKQEKRAGYKFKTAA